MTKLATESPLSDLAHLTSHFFQNSSQHLIMTSVSINRRHPIATRSSYGSLNHHFVRSGIIAASIDARDSRASGAFVVHTFRKILTPPCQDSSLFVSSLHCTLLTCYFFVSTVPLGLLVGRST